MASWFNIWAQDRITDWPDYNRYAQANREIRTPVRAVFMGNSITDFWPEQDPAFFTSHGYVGRGISGQVSAQMLMRFRQDVIDLHPEAVVILAGTNDIAQNDYAVTPDQTFDNVVSMIQLAQANGIAVVLCSTMPASSFPWRPDIKPAEQIAKLNTRLRRYAEDNGIVFVDYHSAMKDRQGGLPKEYSEDGVHPNLQGYKVMERLVQEGLEKVLK